MESFVEVWELVKEYCKEQITNVAYNIWICCIDTISLDGNTATLSVRSPFQKGIIEEKYLNLLNKGFEQVLGFSVEIKVEATESNSTKSDIGQTTKSGDSDIFHEAAENQTVKKEHEYSFDNFIVGPSNKFAHAASLAVASNPSGAYNPLFIYGGSGLGITHLLYAICNEVAESRPELNIIYVKGEEFTNELIEAIGRQATHEFHEKYRCADLLLVDDIQFIGGKTQTQEEFFHTFNELYHANKQIVLTSDRPPKEIKTLEERLRTRFEWGLLADVQPPDFETRIAIIRRKSEIFDVEIPEDVAEFISNKLKNNIRQLEGAVKKLKAYKMLTNTPPSITIVQTAIKDILNDNQPLPITIEKILNEVSRTCDVTPNDIRSSKRSANVSDARKIAAYIIREITQMTMHDIGEEFGGRDHSTIVYATQQVEKKMKNNLSYKQKIEDIIKNIKNT